jgi:hypothetical protein
MRELVDLGEDHQIDELVLNTSLAAALPQNGDDPLPKLFVEIQNFLDEVRFETTYLHEPHVFQFCLFRPV